MTLHEQFLAGLQLPDVVANDLPGSVLLLPGGRLLLLCGMLMVRMGCGVFAQQQQQAAKETIAEQPEWRTEG